MKVFIAVVAVLNLIVTTIVNFSVVKFFCNYLNIKLVVYTKFSPAKFTRSSVPCSIICSMVLVFAFIPMHIEI